MVARGDGGMAAMDKSMKALLMAKIRGIVSNDVGPVTPDMKVKGNIFRYKSETKQKMNLFGFDDELVKCRFKRERIVPKTPYKLFVWNNQHSTQPVLKYHEHTAAVKAIAWSPHLYGLLASELRLTKLATLTGHADRVTHLAISPNGQKIVTGTGGETLRFWNVFPPRKSQGKKLDYSEYIPSIIFWKNTYTLSAIREEKASAIF
ncbi:FIZZY-related 2-like protein [Tanacetum coccineum]